VPNSGTGSGEGRGIKCMVRGRGGLDKKGKKGCEKKKWGRRLAQLCSRYKGEKKGPLRATNPDRKKPEGENTRGTLKDITVQGPSGIDRIPPRGLGRES